MPVPTGRDRRPVPIDPALATKVGLHHTLPSAVADIVDNSIDADAASVRIRILLEGDRPLGLQVVDNGRGMDDATLDEAMTYARERDYAANDLGHFGVGLKAASLSQADTLLVLSRREGHAAAGRRLDRIDGASPPELSVLDPVDVASRLSESRPGEDWASGTVVEWRDVRTFPASHDTVEQRRWLTETITALRRHLGLTYHRILAGEIVEITVEVVDVTTDMPGARREVLARDPFGYPRSGLAGYPQDLRVEVPGGPGAVTVRAHLWPARSKESEYLLDQPSADELQGFYVYRRDRLLQVGGWCGVRSTRPEWACARLEVDLGPGADRHATINPEKSGVTFHADLVRAIELGMTTETEESFPTYLEHAAELDRKAKSRRRQPITVVRPGVGLPGDVVAGYESALAFADATDPVDIRWRTLPEGDVFSVDRDDNVIALNLRYRTVLVGRRSHDLDDAPVVKTLLHLLLNHHFEGSHLGHRERAQIQAWNDVLLAAVHRQQKDQEAS